MSPTAGAVLPHLPTAGSLLPWAEHNLGLVVVVGVVVVVLLYFMGPRFAHAGESSLDRYQRDVQTHAAREFYADHPEYAPRGSLLRRFLRWLFRIMGGASEGDASEFVAGPRQEHRRSEYEAQRAHEREEQARSAAEETEVRARIDRVSAEARARESARQGQAPRKPRLPAPKVDLWDDR